MLDAPGHLFDPQRRFGVLPINFNFGPDNLVHKGQFLCIGETPQQCQELLSLARKDLPWQFDRD